MGTRFFAPLSSSGPPHLRWATPENSGRYRARNALAPLGSRRWPTASGGGGCRPTPSQARPPIRPALSLGLTTRLRLRANDGFTSWLRLRPFVHPFKRHVAFLRDRLPEFHLMLKVHNDARSAAPPPSPQQLGASLQGSAQGRLNGAQLICRGGQKLCAYSGTHIASHMACPLDVIAHTSMCQQSRVIESAICHAI